MQTKSQKSVENAGKPDTASQEVDVEVQTFEALELDELASIVGGKAPIAVVSD